MEIDVTSKCRICFAENEEMHHLYTSLNQGISLYDILSSTTGFEIPKGEPFSPYLCQSCSAVIVDFYNLKTTFKENQDYITQLLAEIKVDSDMQEDDESVKESDKQTEDDLITIQIVPDTAIDDEKSLKIDDNDVDSNIDNIFNETEIESDLISYNKKSEDNSQEALITTYACPECGDHFLNKTDLEVHLAQNHEDIKYQFILTTTTSTTEEIDNNTTCKICKMKFESSAENKQHFETMHKSPNMFICYICSAVFGRRSYLKDHLEIHFPEKRHVCNFCNKAFKRRTVLVKHKRIHTNPRECVCEVCGRAFNDKGTLKTHISLVHLKERNYCCDLCGEKFPLKSTLEKHVRRHQSKERLFFCTECPLDYKDKSSLDRHIYTKHSGINVRVQCGQCGRFYASASGLAKHKRICQSHNTASKYPSDIVKIEKILI